MPVRNLARGLAAALSLFALAAPAAAQSSDPAWLDELSDQLASEKQCQVDYYINTREDTLAGREVFEARAQCRDGRQFDASRIEPAETFTLSLCKIQVC